MDPWNRRLTLALASAVVISLSVILYGARRNAAVVSAQIPVTTAAFYETLRNGTQAMGPKNLSDDITKAEADYGRVTEFAIESHVTSLGGTHSEVKVRVKRTKVATLEILEFLDGTPIRLRVKKP